MSKLDAEVAIVGAGPIGIELHVALKRAGIRCLHFDAKQIGYTISWFAPQTKFFSSNERIAIAGVPLQTADQSKATREEYLAYLRSIVVQFNLPINTYEPIIGVDRLKNDDGFELTTRPSIGEKKYRVGKLVLVTGGTDRPRTLGIPGETLPHVSAYFQDPHWYFRKRVLIVGGKNSAVEAALRCHQAGAFVSMSYRGQALPEKSIKYWLLPEINGLISEGRIESHFATVPTQITASHVRLRATNGDDPREIDVPADFVLMLIGYEQDNTLFKLAGLKLDGDCGAPTFDERTMETSVPNCFVAGTAVGGTQDKYRVFIENCHVHVERIVATLTGKTSSKNLKSVEYAREES